MRNNASNGSTAEITFAPRPPQQPWEPAPPIGWFEVRAAQPFGIKEVGAGIKIVGGVALTLGLVGVGIAVGRRTT